MIDVFYLNIKDKKNKLFSLILNEIFSKLEIYIYERPRILFNVPYLCESKVKYKRYCEFNIKPFFIEISEIGYLDLVEIKARLSLEYYNYLNVFNRLKANKLPSHRLYDYRLEFVNDMNYFKLSRSRIYSISSYKLKEVKKYLDKYLRKNFITPSKILFIFLVLFAEKPNKELRFYVDYRRLNEITKRNRYLILLIDKILIKIQGCKYLTRLNIIAIFNKLRMHLESEDYITFVTFLGVYKYRVLLFDLINESTIY